MMNLYEDILASVWQPQRGTKGSRGDGGLGGQVFMERPRGGKGDNGAATFSSTMLLRLMNACPR